MVWHAETWGIGPIKIMGQEQSPGILLQKLLSGWRTQHPRRAAGGWWALCGFGFQAGVFLLRFFRNLEDGSVEPGEFAEMEHLSDILCPEGGCLRLIQVKWTLTRSTLMAALEEAYLIVDLCRRETPELLRRLRFQIVCHGVQDGAPRDVRAGGMGDVIKEGGDAETWWAMLEQFDQAQPIAVEPDPLDQLHLYLWNAGVEDTTALIEACSGRLLESFGASGPSEWRSVGAA